MLSADMHTENVFVFMAYKTAWFAWQHLWRRGGTTIAEPCSLVLTRLHMLKEFSLQVSTDLAVTQD